MSYELLLARRRILMASNRVWPTLLYISEAEVSMCCKDGTDGKGGVFQLHPFFDDGLDHKSQCTWTTSNASRATVNGSGLVSFSAATSYGDVTISCSYRGVTKTCLLTVYETMPSAEVDGAGLWLCKGGKGRGLPGSRVVDAEFKCNQSMDIVPVCGFCDVIQINPTNNAQIIDTRGALGGYVLFSFEYGLGQSVAKFTNALGNRHSRCNTISSVGSSTRFDLLHNSLNYWYRGGVSVGEYDYTTAGVSPVVPVTRLNFDRCLKKATHAAINSTPVNAANRRSRIFFERFYIPQNYIKYTDRDTWVNYTVIPNIGTLGSTFDLPCNNVPSAWFGV